MEDVSHHHSPFERFKGKSVAPLVEQRLPPSVVHGLHLASQRGVRLLLDQYVVTLQVAAKEQLRCKEEQKHLKTSEDRDMEKRCEGLSLSPLLFRTSRWLSLSMLDCKDLRMQLWVEVGDYVKLVDSSVVDCDNPDASNVTMPEHGLHLATAFILLKQEGLLRSCGWLCRHGPVAQRRFPSLHFSL
jgi:hypothetical protein